MTYRFLRSVHFNDTAVAASEDGAVTNLYIVRTHTRFNKLINLNVPAY